MIVAERLVKLYGRRPAVRDIDFEIPAGKVVGFLGPNGAGKTTTIRMIAGIFPPTSGRILVNGKDVVRQSKYARRRIGYLPESTPLYTEMRVREYLHFRAKLFGLSRPERRRAVESSLRRCWLEHVERQPIHQLSKGYRQRVGLAAALLHDPKVLLLDEPTVGLDPTQIREVRGLIRELAGKHTILLSSHILPEVEQTCDQILMISHGRIRARGTIDELRAQAAPQDRYVVEVESPDVVSSIRKMKGIRDVGCVPLDQRWHRITFTADETSGDLRERVAEILRKRDVGVRELRRDVPTLEQLFVELTVNDEEADEASEHIGPPAAPARMAG